MGSDPGIMTPDGGILKGMKIQDGGNVEGVSMGVCLVQPVYSGMGTQERNSLQVTSLLQVVSSLPVA